MSHSYPPARSQRRRSSGCLIALAVVVGGLVLLVGCSAVLGALGDGPEPTPSASTAAEELSAEELVEELGDVYPLSNPRDTTDGCQNDHENDCLMRITTDVMSVYEFPDEAVAEHWTTTFADGSGDARQVGRFMLLWHAESSQSAEARDELEARAWELVGSE